MYPYSVEERVFKYSARFFVLRTPYILGILPRRAATLLFDSHWQESNRVCARETVPPCRTVASWPFNRGSKRVDGVLIPLSVSDSQYAWVGNVGGLRERIGGIGDEL